MTAADSFQDCDSAVPAWLGSRTDAASSSVLDACRASGVLLAVSESLTGGLVSDAFVRIPGASDVFLGSAVTYDVAAKASVLGVDEGLLAREGAVRAAVADQMATGTARLFGGPHPGTPVIGLSTTGVAGPGPDDRGNPQGLVYVGVFLPEIFSAPTVPSLAALSALHDDGVLDCGAVRDGALRDGDNGSPDIGVAASLAYSRRIPAVSGSSASEAAVSAAAFGKAIPGTEGAGRVDVLELRCRGSREGIRRRAVFALLEYVSHLTAPRGE